MTTARTAARIAAAGLVLVTLGAQAFQLRGFRGVEWGAEAERLGSEATVVSKEGELTCYQRANENLLFGDTELKAVRYCFLNDRLYSVRLDAAVSAKALTAEFQRTYGRPDVRQGQNATWGRKPTDSRAELVVQGAHSQITLSPDSTRQAELARQPSVTGTGH
jgi:hypothetical protein